MLNHFDLTAPRDFEGGGVLFGGQPRAQGRDDFNGRFAELRLQNKRVRDDANIGDKPAKRKLNGRYLFLFKHAGNINAAELQLFHRGAAVFIFEGLHLAVNIMPRCSEHTVFHRQVFALLRQEVAFRMGVLQEDNLVAFFVGFRNGAGNAVFQICRPRGL